MRYTVLTYNFGGYEQVHEVKEKDPEAEYILVTDDVTAKSKTWQIVWAHTDDRLTPFEKCYDVRYHPFEYAQSDIVVRLDGSIGINKSLKPIIDEFERRDADRCLMIHPARNTMPDEYAAWVSMRNYPQEQANRCMNLMRKMGYDMGNEGLFQACFEVVRFNRTNQLINDTTYDLLRLAASDGTIGRINQTWLTFTINHLFSDQLRVMPVSQDIITNSDLMTWYLHNSHRKNLERPSIAPVMFGKPIETRK